MKQLTSDEIKETIFQILCDFADFCDENGIRYYLCGGTLLGAIRHKGFIPWDDDIDVLMPRPDFDKLHQVFQKGCLKEYYELIGINAGNSFWPFAKMVDKRTKIINEFTTTDQWLWIDIFPMDGLPDDIEESNKHLRKAAPLKKWINRSHAKLGMGQSFFRKIMKFPMVIMLKIISPERIGRKMDKTARKYDFNQCDYIGGACWSLGPKERMVKKDYLPVTDVVFNGRKFHAPACWDAYLTSMFGDYMTLPPEEERVTHEFNAYFLD